MADQYEKNHALCAAAIHCARFCSYAFLSKCIRVNRKIKKSCKLQAASLTTDLGCCRMNLERNNMDKEINGHLYIANDNLKRIADAVVKRTNYRTGEVTELRGIRNALEEILRLVKEDQEKMRKISEKN